MKCVILVKGSECRVYGVEDENTAKYWFLRRIEKEGWQADQAWIVEGDGLPLAQWSIDAEREYIQRERERIAREEREQYERLKKKYGGEL